MDAELVIDAREVALDRFLAEVERGRMIVTPGPALAKIPCVIAVAYGVSKSAAVRAAINAGMVHGLITHASLARELLKLAQS